MKIVMFLSLFISMTAIAGPSISAGPAPAPWLRSQGLFAQTLKYLTTNLYTINSIEIKPNDPSKVYAQVDCGNGSNGDLVFNAETECQEGIPNFCLPQYSVTLDKGASKDCK